MHFKNLVLVRLLKKIVVLFVLASKRFHAGNLCFNTIQQSVLTYDSRRCSGLWDFVGKTWWHSVVVYRCCLISLGEVQVKGPVSIKCKAFHSHKFCVVRVGIQTQCTSKPSILLIANEPVHKVRQRVFHHATQTPRLYWKHRRHRNTSSFR